MSSSARVLTALVAGLLLGVAASLVTSEFSWGSNTVGISTIVIGVAVGMLVASSVPKDDRRQT